ncbi:MAG TPA: DNA topoisomerase IB [Kofleriaceae bacterium]
MHADEPGLARRKRGAHFAYVDGNNNAVRDPATLRRIRALVIPPAWTNVWIAADPNGHIQATGRDARGRKQYRYHPRWRALRDDAKYHRLVAFCAVLPKLRATVARDLGAAKLTKRKVVATIVALMEAAQLRVGNDEYARTNGSYGATTLRDRHAKIHGDTIELAYRGKAGVARHVKLTDRRLAKIVRSCRDLPGQRLFQYVDGDRVRPIASTDVNAYLRDVTHGAFTAKDYRTWAGTLGAALLVACAGQPAPKQVIATVAEKLGHTPAVCKGSYIHPRVMDDAQLAEAIRRRVGSDVALAADSIRVERLRAIEPIVARALAARSKLRA